MLSSRSSYQQQPQPHTVLSSAASADTEHLGAGRLGFAFEPL